jgi:hypothetical protein
MSVLPFTLRTSTARLAEFKINWADDKVKQKLDTASPVYNAPP